jgi:hypothetical protein
MTTFQVVSIALTTELSPEVFGRRVGVEPTTDGVLMRSAATEQSRARDGVTGHATETSKKSEACGTLLLALLSRESNPRCAARGSNPRTTTPPVRDRLPPKLREITVGSVTRGHTRAYALFDCQRAQNDESRRGARPGRLSRGSVVKLALGVTLRHGAERKRPALPAGCFRVDQ